MEQIPGMNDTAIILLIILMAIGGAAVYAIFAALRGHAPRHAEESPLMRACLALLLVIGGYLILWPRHEPVATVQRDRPLAAVIDKHCPPADRDAPAIITMLITSQADERPAITHCQRYRNPYDKPSPARQALRLTEAK